MTHPEALTVIEILGAKSVTVIDADTDRRFKTKWPSCPSCGGDNYFRYGPEGHPFCTDCRPH